MPLFSDAYSASQAHPYWTGDSIIAFPTHPTRSHAAFPNIDTPFGKTKFNLINTLAPIASQYNRNNPNDLKALGGVINSIFKPKGSFDVRYYPNLPGVNRRGQTEYGKLNNRIVTGDYLNHHLYGLGLGALGFHENNPAIQNQFLGPWRPNHLRHTNSIVAGLKQWRTPNNAFQDKALQDYHQQLQAQDAPEADPPVYRAGITADSGPHNRFWQVAKEVGKAGLNALIAYGDELNQNNANRDTVPRRGPHPINTRRIQHTDVTLPRYHSPQHREFNITPNPSLHFDKPAPLYRNVEYDPAFKRYQQIAQQYRNRLQQGYFDNPLTNNSIESLYNLNRNVIRSRFPKSNIPFNAMQPRTWAPAVSGLTP